MPQIDTLLDEGTHRLAQAGVDSPRFEARLLLELATGLTREQLVIGGHGGIGLVEAKAFRGFVARRAAREPMAYIRGRAEFFGLDFALGSDVLVPRPETETLIEVARLGFPEDGARFRVLDLGTGSGCLLVTLLTLYRAASGVGTDISEAALTVAGLNAAAHRVEARATLRQTSWGAGLEEPFDLIVSNPPYIAAGELGGLMPEVGAYEPRCALDGGAGGLDAYHALTPDLRRLLAADGIAVLEIGRSQEGELLPWFERHGFAIRSFRDLAGVVRCLELRRRPR